MGCRRSEIVLTGELSPLSCGGMKDFAELRASEYETSLVLATARCEGADMNLLRPGECVCI